LKLRESLEKAIRLGAFADAGGTDEDDASCPLEAHFSGM
jgi:hypothetical protein